ncbi:EF-P 5-aminopentanol modification-associated protein YfmF [Listeria aquatica]|uniref:Peptidase M16 C-terminal domain-containing protein n=1 Tax=Listeria aquatica FSL S10-1188 TaxID=1265818 RepID=W7AQY8_9LIST|nr:pitrilysin family protein [Listeria aquatica]EUJ17594.1 hypothetical protein MAQA_11201 [Listeria aquatica FSL S10-1188]
MQTYEEKIGPVRLTLLETKKFKSSKIVFKFRAPLERETITKRTLLSMLFETNNELYKTQTEFRRRLAYLYGANFYTTVEKKGNEHIITAVFDLVNGKLVKDGEKLLKEAFQFIEQVFFFPNVSDAAFHEATLEREKANLKSRLESVFDDKIRYANKRLIEEMFSEDVFKYPASGVLEDVDAIGATDLYQYYQRFLKEDQIDLLVCGDITRDELIPQVEALSFSEREKTLGKNGSETYRTSLHEVFENQPINQGKLALGYHTGVYFGDENFVPLQLANGLLGGYSNSKIFINVREKASLAYYASSRMDSFKGFMLISAGIDEKNYKQAREIIEEQVEAMKRGDFTEEELEQTKKMYINQLLEANDSAQGLIELTYNNLLKQADLDLANWIQKIKQTTKDEVTKAAQVFEMNTLYFLSKEVTGNE